MENTIARQSLARSSSRDQLIADSIPLVTSIAARVRATYGLSTPFEDLRAIGLTGLLEAVGRFDPDRGVAFPTFAYYRIRGAILDSVRREASQRSLLSVARRLPGAVRANEYLAAQADETHGGYGDDRSGSPGPLQELSWVLSDLATIELTSIDAMDALSDGIPVEPEEEIERKRLSDRVRSALATLPERERRVIELHYYGDHSFEEIGQKLGVCKPWAFRLHRRAIRLLREALGESNEDANGPPA